MTYGERNRAYGVARHAVAAALAVSCTVAMASGCSTDRDRAASEADRGSTGGERGSGAPAGSAQVDPSVLSDVIEAAFPSPGDGIRRMMRVRLFARSLLNEACGGPPLGDIDATGGRYEQAAIPDLDLIRERGLSEPDPAGNKLVSLGPCADEVLPAYRDWFNLGAPWSDVLTNALQSAPVVKQRPEAAGCLEDRTSLPVDESDPAASFISQTDREMSSGRGSATQMRDFSVAYADCTAAYFEAIAHEVEARRPEMIERNRELLESFAQQIVSAGYVP